MSVYAGWQNHPVSRHRYHFIVPVEGGFVSAHTPEEFAAFPALEGAMQACMSCIYSPCI